MARTRLEGLLSRVRDARTVALVDASGESAVVVGAEMGGDVDGLGRSLVDQWRAVDSEPDPLDGGYLRLFVVETDSFRILLGPVSESQCLMLVMGVAGNDGQARFELRRTLQELQRQADRIAV